MTEITSKPDHGETVMVEGVATARLQLFYDDIESKLNIPTLPVFTVADLITTIPPATSPKIPASARLDGLVMVSNETAGRVPAYSNGANWKRFSDNNNIST